MKAILKAAGCDMNDVVKTTVLLTDINDYPAVNEIYAKFFTKDFPARSAFAVKTLPKLGYELLYLLYFISLD